MVLTKPLTILSKCPALLTPLELALALVELPLTELALAKLPLAELALVELLLAELAIAELALAEFAAVFDSLEIEVVASERRSLRLTAFKFECGYLRHTLSTSI